jgi:hypothetical protein
MGNFWGWHSLIDCAECDLEAITNPDTLRDFAKALVEEIEMIPYGEPQIIHFGHNADHLAGWTVIQLIETSNIIAHFCDNTGEGYIDVFSCKEYDINIAVEVIKRFFNPKSVRVNFLTRQA